MQVDDYDFERVCEYIHEQPKLERFRFLDENNVTKTVRDFVVYVSDTNRIHDLTLRAVDLTTVPDPKVRVLCVISQSTSSDRNLHGMEWIKEL